MTYLATRTMIITRTKVTEYTYNELYTATKLRKPSEKARCRWSNQPEGTRPAKKVGTIKNDLLINQFRRKGRRSVKDRI